MERGFHTCELLSNERTDHGNEINFKVVVVGTTGVGKSSITKQATSKNFEENYKATIGFEFFVLNYKIDNQIIKLQIWDTCGQEIYRSIVANFYRSSSLAFLVYSIDNKESFLQLSSWLTEIRMFSNPEIKIFLVGNKCDLDNNNTRQVSFEEGQKFQVDNKLDYFLETSAKMDFNIQEAFMQSVKLLYNEYLKYKNLYNSNTNVFSSVDTKNSSKSFKLKKIRKDREVTESEEVVRRANANLGCSC